MQEEIVEKSVAIGFQVANLTATAILKGLEAITAALEKKPDEKTPDTVKDAQTPKDPELKQGKQTLKELHKHNEGLSSIELTDPNLRQLHKSMKKADIDFSCVKDGKGKYTLFFKGKNADEMTHAFKRYTKKIVMQKATKPIKTDLKEAKTAAKALDKGRDKVKNKSKGALEK
jgi:hypothetical protein